MWHFSFFIRHLLINMYVYMVYNPDDNLYPLPNCKRNSDKKSDNKSDYSFELFFKHFASKKRPRTPHKSAASLGCQSSLAVWGFRRRCSVLWNQCISEYFFMMKIRQKIISHSVNRKFFDLSFWRGYVRFLHHRFVSNLEEKERLHICAALLQIQSCNLSRKTLCILRAMQDS